MPLSIIFQLYRGCKFHWWRKPEYQAGENQQPATRHWQTWSHDVVHLAMSGIGPHKISDDRCQLHRLGSCKSNYHTITTQKLSNQYSWQEHVYNSCNQQGGAGMSLWVDTLYFHICVVGKYEIGGAWRSTWWQYSLSILTVYFVGYLYKFGCVWKII